MTAITENPETALALSAPLDDLGIKRLIFEIWLYLADRRVEKTMKLLER